jgi:hypothetical protein
MLLPVAANIKWLSAVLNFVFGQPATGADLKTNLKVLFFVHLRFRLPNI